MPSAEVPDLEKCSQFFLSKNLTSEEVIYMFSNVVNLFDLKKIASILLHTTYLDRSKHNDAYNGWPQST